MAEEKKAEAKKSLGLLDFKTTDSLYEKLSSRLSERIGNFVAFIFFVMTIGVVIGVWGATHFSHLVTYIIVAPAAVGLIAYYNRDFATFLFIILVGFLLFI